MRVAGAFAGHPTSGLPSSLRSSRPGVALLCLLAFGAAGCSPIGTAIGAAAFTADLATQERGLYQGLDDNAMWIAINGRFAAYDAKVLQQVHLQVQEGRVLLTGHVQKPEHRLAAVRAAWATAGVREVINQVKIAPDRGMGTVAQDEFLARRVWLKLFADRAVRANNYSIECIDSVVYLIGVGQDQAELQRAIDHARDVPYVRNVESYVRLKGDPLPPEPPPPSKAPEIMPAGTLPGDGGSAPGAANPQPAQAAP
ncbi:MAG: BON domain-containing protein [Rhodospirillaceae bacterium]|jgi:osmotically-inducible protein OsmY|nr:BON domain-containing protein [Rhodospirillaceae bacterium]